MPILSFDQINQIAAAYAAAETARNAPAAVARRAIYTLVSTMGDLSTDEDVEIRQVLSDELAALDQRAWGVFGAALADR